MRTVSELLELVFEAPEQGVDAFLLLPVYAELREVATPTDLPDLLEALESPRGDFWSREMLAEPIAEHGGLLVLRQLLAAYQRNIDDGWDNDGFGATLWDLFNSGEDPRPELRRLAVDNAYYSEVAQWWLDHGLD